MTMVRILLLLCLISAPLQAGQPEPTDHPDYGIVKGVIEDSIGWAIDKDLDRLFRGLRQRRRSLDLVGRLQRRRRRHR